MQRDLQGLDEVAVRTRVAPVPLVEGPIVQAGIWFCGAGTKLAEWVGAKVLATELAERLSPADVSLWSLDPSSSVAGWAIDDEIRDLTPAAGDGVVELATALDVVVSTIGADSPRLPEDDGVQPVVLLPWRPRGQNEALNIDDLVSLAPRWLSVAEAHQCRPGGIAGDFLAVAVSDVDLLTQFVRTSIDRHAASRGLSVQLIAAAVDVDLDEAASTWGKAMTVGIVDANHEARELIGALANATAVVATDPATAALALAYNPRVVALSSNPGELRRDLWATTTKIHDIAAANRADDLLDRLAALLETIAAARIGRELQPERSLAVMRRRLDDSRKAQVALSHRLKSERQRLVVQNRLLVDMADEALAERDDARAEAASLLAEMRRGSGRLNKLELRLAELDQGAPAEPVAPGAPLWKRALRRLERRALRDARALWRRVHGR